MLHMILQKKGIQQIVDAIDGVEAVHAVEEHGIDYFQVIFMDSVMPNMAGKIVVVVEQ
jgi:CheY-like chemotaxis protein